MPSNKPNSTREHRVKIAEVVPMCDAEFPARLKELREALGLTQRALADQGVSHAHISRLEGGTRHPSGRVLGILARKLGVTTDYLAWGKYPEPLISEHEAHVLAIFGGMTDEEFGLLQQALEALRAKESQEEADPGLEEGSAALSDSE